MLFLAEIELFSLSPFFPGGDMGVRKGGGWFYDRLVCYLSSVGIKPSKRVKALRLGREEVEKSQVHLYLKK